METPKVRNEAQELLKTTGILSPEAFEISSVSFLKAARQCKMNWRLETVNEVKFLSLLELRRIRLMGEDTDATLISYQYDIVYNQSYSVPSLYFNMSMPDGSRVSLDKIWSLVGPQNKQDMDLWSFISQQDHPIHNIPFFTLHPCSHENVMKELSKSVKISVENYLIAWFSLICNILKLELPNEFAKIIS